MRVLRTLDRLLWRGVRLFLLGIAATFVLCTVLSFIVHSVTVDLTFGYFAVEVRDGRTVFVPVPDRDHMSVVFSGLKLGCSCDTYVPEPIVRQVVFEAEYRTRHWNWTSQVAAPWVWAIASLCALPWAYRRVQCWRSGGELHVMRNSRVAPIAVRLRRGFLQVLLGLAAVFAFCTALSFAVGDIRFEAILHLDQQAMSFDAASATVTGFEIEYRHGTYGPEWADRTPADWRVPGVLVWHRRYFKFLRIHDGFVYAPWIWAILILGTLPWIVPAIRRRWRSAHGHCVQCGYDLTGNVSGRCPECGAEVQTAKDGHDHVAASSSTSSASESGHTSPD